MKDKGLRGEGLSQVKWGELSGGLQWPSQPSGDLHEGKKKDVTEETKEGNEVRHVRTYAELEGAGRHRQEERRIAQGGKSDQCISSLKFILPNSER